MKTIIVSCDVCKGQISPRPHDIQVIFVSDQNEGKPSEPYLDEVTIDICKLCIDKVMSGKYIFSRGALGNNEYFFQK